MECHSSFALLWLTLWCLLEPDKWTLERKRCVAGVDLFENQEGKRGAKTPATTTRQPDPKKENHKKKFSRRFERLTYRIQPITELQPIALPLSYENK